jgi:predicted GNAT family N-acyltransferase
MNIVFKQITFGSPEYDKEIALRTKILREPLGLTYTGQQLAEEISEQHFGAYSGDKLIACLLLKQIDPETVQMRQVAVAAEHQKRGVGKMLAVYAESIARENKYSKMILHAREVVSEFYLKLGYETVGATYLEVGIPHITMEKMLTD